MTLCAPLLFVWHDRFVLPGAGLRCHDQRDGVPNIRKSDRIFDCWKQQSLISYKFIRRVLTYLTMAYLFVLLRFKSSAAGPWR